VDADGNELETFPADLQRLEETLAEKQLKIKYDTLDGWLTSTTGCKRWEDLPAKAREYVKFIEDRVGVPVQYIGTGPHREHMIARWPTWCHS
jgi:adenylosuccinate synthase